MVREMEKIACFVLFLATSAATSAEPPKITRKLTLSDAIKAADENSLDLMQARARLEQSGTGIQAARAALLPTIALQGKYTHNSYAVELPATEFADSALQVGDALVSVSDDLYAQTGKTPSANVSGALSGYQQVKTAILTAPPIVITPQEQLDASVSVQLPLVVPWAWYQLRSAHRTVDAAEANFKVSRAQTLLLVAQYFYLAAGNEEVVTARHHAIEVAQKTLDDAIARVEVGAGNLVDQGRAQVAYDRAVQSATEAEAAREQAFRTLSTAIGVTGPYGVEVGNLPQDRFGPGDDLAAMGRSLRPEFSLNIAQVSASQVSSKSNGARWWPTLSAFGQARTFNYAGFAGKNYAWSVGVQLDWALYDGGSSAASKRQFAALASEASARLTLLQLTISDDIANARRDLDVKHLAVGTAERAVSLSQQTLDLIRVQHDSGAISQLDLLTAQDALVSAELTLAQARFDRALADITLQRQVGTFPPEQ